MRQALAAVLVLMGLLIASPGRTDTVNAVVEDAIVRQPPPGAMVAAGYLRFTNTGDTAVALLGASSDAFAKVELHLSVIENEVAKMIRQESVLIPAGDSLEFRHGSYHLMLMGPKNELETGQTIPLTLVTDQGNVRVMLMVVGKDEAPATKLP